MNNKTADEFLRLVKIMDELREKCPWDRKQTINTLRYLTIEETYELTDAIDEEDWKGIKEELGDLLLHLVFYAKRGSEQNKFTLDEVIAGISDKLISRHPHIYGEGVMGEGLKEVADEEDVKQNWEKLKLKEGKKSILGGVPKSLPSVVKAIRLQEKTDVMFSLVNLARFLQVDADSALERTNKKFIRRFTAVEAAAAAQGKAVHDMSLHEMDALWNEIKKAEKAK